MATYTWLFFLFSVIPLGEGAFATSFCSSPFALRRQTRPVGSAMPLWPWSVKYRSPLSAKCRSFKPLKLSLNPVSTTGSTRPVLVLSASRPRR